MRHLAPHLPEGNHCFGDAAASPTTFLNSAFFLLAQQCLTSNLKPNVCVTFFCLFISWPGHCRVDPSCHVDTHGLAKTWSEKYTFFPLIFFWITMQPQHPLKSQSPFPLVFWTLSPRLPSLRSVTLVSTSQPPMPLGWQYRRRYQP